MCRTAGRQFPPSRKVTLQKKQNKTKNGYVTVLCKDANQVATR